MPNNTVNIERVTNKHPFFIKTMYSLTINNVWLGNYSSLKKAEKAVAKHTKIPITA